jgi:hypothetical protein
MRKRITTLSRSASKILRERLKNEAIVNAERDLAIAAEWFALEEEVWESNHKVSLGAKSHPAQGAI